MTPKAIWIYAVRMSKPKENEQKEDRKRSEFISAVSAKQLTEDNKWKGLQSSLREDIVGHIRNGVPVYSHQHVEGPLPEDAPNVTIYPRNGVDYLRSDANEIEEDNLGDLPEY